MFSVSGGNDDDRLVDDAMDTQLELGTLRVVGTDRRPLRVIADRVIRLPFQLDVGLLTGLDDWLSCRP